MKRIILILFIISITSALFAVQDLRISGLNEAIYVYKNAEDSLKNYFSDEFSFRFTYKNFTFGMKFIAELPKYDDYAAMEELTSQSISYRWDERFLEYKIDNFSARAGNFEQVFGSGIALRAYRDRDFNIDTRLNGFSAEIFPRSFQAKALYAALPNEDNVTKNDVVAGLDFQKDIFEAVKLGASFVNVREWQAGDNYLDRKIFAARTNLNASWFDLNAEYGYLDQSEGISKIGHALYANLNTYFNIFSFTVAYNNYLNFVSRLNDLPIINHSNEPMYDSPIGKDQQGAMGEISFLPNDFNELILNYSEEWNDDWSIRQTDLWIEGIHYFDMSTLTASFSHLERKDNNVQHWEKEVTPTVMYDFMIGEMPISIKTELQYFDKHYQQEKSHHWEPLVQIDTNIFDFDVSVIAESSCENLKEIGKKTPWLGAEISKIVLKNTTLRLFVGKEKGGKVCRNGICKYRKQFEGLRAELITTF
ncbi:MAG: hypothetical protein JW794_09420 [Candidatus Cloacimonetes bacterium]|nr:hypothetical protein [Candidatus Cloacimonadota bacterium]